jgi:class 3 adenylate cyclase/tetratricopeptide (TPR) repeat protein
MSVKHPADGGTAPPVRDPHGGETVAKDSERRQATVVFADISGFTAMSEKFDPEEVTAVVNECFAALAEAVDDHGGHVDKYIGDCVMALFGVPVALEKAPQNALNAAIEMRNRIAVLNEKHRFPIRLDVHIGVNTGLVIAGQVGGDVKREFTVMGDAVNLASRLKDKAPNGSIWVGYETYRYVRDDFEFRRLEPLALKGKEQRVDAWELLSVTERIHRAKPAAGERMISSPLVGRDPEIALLRACFADVARGEGGVVHLIGEAGLGKSRLLAEACAAPEARAVRVLEGRSISVGRRPSFHPFIDLLRQWSGIADGDDEPQARTKLEAAVAGAVGDGAADVFPFIATLMGMRVTGAHATRLAGIEGEALEKLILKSMRELLRALSAERPLVLVFEDLHWADLSSVKLLDALLGLVPTTPLLFVHAFRPHYEETSECLRRSAHEQQGARVVEIVLTPLDEAACGAFVRHLLKTEQLPYGLVALVSRTGEGNPFYIEEVIRALLDDGVIELVKGRVSATKSLDTVVVPGTVQGVIMARVDRLAESTRHVLQVASVLGRSFYHRILECIVRDGTDLDAELASLKERQLLFERRTHRTASVRRSLLAEEVEYVFQHALVQETIYESILHRTRKELHLRVGATIEEVFADRLPDFYAILAYHFTRAEDLTKAEEYLFKAGDEAARAAASSEALSFFQEASRVYFLLHGAGGDPRKKSLLEKNIALALLNKGALTESIAHFDRALEHLGERVPRGRVAVGTRFALDLAAVLYHVYLRTPRYVGEADVERDRDVVELYFYRGKAETTSDPRQLFLQLPTGLRRFNHIDPRRIDQACGMYVSCAGLFAYSGISFAVSRRMLGIARELVREDSVIDRFVYGAVAFICHYLQGEWDARYTVDDALIEQALRYGQLWDVTSYIGLECDRRLRQGDFARARAGLGKLLEINDTYGYAFASTTREGMEAVLLLEERRLDEAVAVAERYLAGRHEEPLRRFGLGLLAKAELLRGNREGAAAALERGADVGGGAGTIPLWHESTYAASRLLADVVRVEEAGRGASFSLVRTARRSARHALSVARRVAKDRPDILALVARLAWASGRRRRAERWWARALAAAARQGARPALARTHLDMAVRLADGGAHEREAEAMLTALGLAWDLERLQGTSGDASRRAVGA